MSVDEALYILGKNLLGQNVTDRLFPIAKQVVTGFNQVGEGLSTIGGVLPPVALPTGKLITTMGGCGRLLGQINHPTLGRIMFCFGPSSNSLLSVLVPLMAFLS